MHNRVHWLVLFERERIRAVNADISDLEMTMQFWHSS